MTGGSAGLRAARAAAATLVVLAASAGQAGATTWDEPWHREVVSGATAFGLYEVVQGDEHGFTLKRLKQIAGEDTGPTARVDSFYALRLGSLSGHGPEFRFGPGARAYFFLKRAGHDWALATPSTGYAKLQPNGKVIATYRISVHQAEVDAALYEETQRCIFQVLHGAPACDAQVTAFIDEELAKPVESIGPDSTRESLVEFFRQHAALETAGFSHAAVPDATLERFLSEGDMHVQMSALRVLAASSRPDKAERLMRFVEDDHGAPPARVLAVLLLKEIDARAMKPRLLAYAARADEREAGLGIALMDPRIGTHYPHTLKQAVESVGQQLGDR